MLTGVGSALTLSTGLAYYFKYKQGKLTGSEFFKSIVAFNAAAALAGTAATTAAGATTNTAYKDLYLPDKINFYKFFITYASTFIDNLDATNPSFTVLISKLKALQAASQKELDTIYTLVSLFGAVGPAIVIACVPTLVTGVVRNNKDKNLSTS